jgi:hypothetical protein
MSWETYTAVIGQLRRHTRGERFSISYSGMGETLLNPLIFDFIRHVSGDAVTSFASNGALLTEENIRKLIEAGLDRIYFSFNGDEPGVFTTMMGGLSYERVLAQVRSAVALARGTRLTLRANVSITKANQGRLTRIKTLLEGEKLGPVTFSLCHNRGGNLKDEAVCDTPAMDAGHWTCDVMKNTLFVDWQGRAHICDHDIHGEYGLGDLMSEPIETVLRRRDELLRDSSALAICRQCNDIMRIGGTLPLASGGGGNFRDWIYHLHEDLDDPLSEANPAMRWIFKIYEKEGRTDRMVNRLLGLERALTAERDALLVQRDELAFLRDMFTADRAAVAADRSAIQGRLDERDRQFAALHAEYTAVVKRLEDQGRQLSDLHAEHVAMKRDWVWRLARMIRNDVRRLLGAIRGGL